MGKNKGELVNDLCQAWVDYRGMMQANGFSIQDPVDAFAYWLIWHSGWKVEPIAEPQPEKKKEKDDDLPF